MHFSVSFWRKSLSYRISRYLIAMCVNQSINQSIEFFNVAKIAVAITKSAVT